MRGCNAPVLSLVAQLEDLMDNLKFPLVSKDLLEELEKRFSDKAPIRGAKIDDIMFDAGQVNVVRMLRHQFNLQNQNILEN